MPTRDRNSTSEEKQSTEIAAAVLAGAWVISQGGITQEVKIIEAYKKMLIELKNAGDPWDWK